MSETTPVSERTDWHAATLEEVFAELATSPDGLSEQEALARLTRDGANRLEAGQRVTILSLALHQLASPLIYMLLAAAFVSLLAQHPVDAIVIAAVVVLNTMIGVMQEWRAEKALQALERMSAPRARVVREGSVQVIPADEVVVGDVLVLETGDRIAADARVIESFELHLDESALTGESDPVHKHDEPVGPSAALGDRTSIVWTSSPVTAGRGRAVVTATGMRTIIGEIATAVQSAGREKTPLQRRLASLGTLIGIAAISVAAFAFALGIAQGYEVVEMLLFSVAAAVSAIPEGLPAVISVVLAVGVRRMAARNAIVRRLPAVETLGSTTVICSDKTGTITRNEMTTRKLWAGGRVYELTGEGYDPVGELRSADGAVVECEADARRLLEIGALANNAIHERVGGAWRIEGSPTEGALLVAAAKCGLDVQAMRFEKGRVDEIPFSSKHKYMAVLQDLGETHELLVKGAPERLLPWCTHILIDGEVRPLDESTVTAIREANEALAAEALRVVASAYRTVGADVHEIEHEDVERELVFVGLWGLLDPPRAEAIASVAAAQGAGVRVVMITGDHAATANAIAERSGILVEESETVTGEELDAMSDEELTERAPRIAVYARVSPEHKLRVVRALQENGEIVAMTGDGVNDAPALRQADIGVAMGLSGTEVAKEAADMVLTDDNFASIVRAMEHGRVIFSNLRRVVFYLVTTNLGELITLIGALILALPLPLTAVMILWVNLVTDTMCTIPLGLEPGHRNVLLQPPRPPREGVLDSKTLLRIALLAPIVAAGTLGHFVYALSTSEYEHARTVAFTTLVAFEWFRALASRSRTETIFTIGLFSNRLLVAGIALGAALQLTVLYWPPAQAVFATTPLSLAEWLRVLAIASSVFIIDEFLKVFRKPD